jgi:hypothetical protein
MRIDAQLRMSKKSVMVTDGDGDGDGDGDCDDDDGGSGHSSIYLNYCIICMNTAC